MKTLLIGILATVTPAVSALAAQSSPVAPSDSWCDVMSQNDETLEQLQLSSAKNSRMYRRALLTRGVRNIHRSFSDAADMLATATEVIGSERSVEAVFSDALRCQIEFRQALPGANQRCEALENLEIEVNDPSVRSYVQLTLAFYLSRTGAYEKAEAKAQIAIELAERANNNALIALTHTWLGVQYSVKHLPELSLYHYEAAWNAAELVEWPELKQIIRFNSATVYTQLGRDQEALLTFEEALTWPMLNVSNSNALVIYASMAYSLVPVGEAARGEKLLTELIKTRFDDVQDDTKIQAYDALAQTQLAQNKLSEAIESFGNAMALFDPSTSGTNPRSLAVMVPYGEALRRAGREAEALNVIDGVIKQLDLDSPNDLLRRAHNERASILLELDRPEEAEVATAEAQRVADMLASDALNYQISRLKVAIELEQSNRELEVARQREATLRARAKQETMLRYLLIALAVLLLTVGYLLFSRHLQTRIAQTERAVSERLEEKVKLRTEQLEEQMAERLDAEVDRRHLLGKLAEGEKMRALGQLTAGVAHDFNNLMTAVTLTTEYLKTTQTDNQGKRDALLDDILTATDSAARITSGLLAYARQQPLQPKVLQLDKFLEESSLIFRNTLGERNQLVTRFTPCRVKVDQGQLTSALLNLVINAKEAIGDRGVVEISLSTEKDLDTDQQIAVISVQDSGCGMSEEELIRATEPFYTTKPVGEGTGLGLSMVYGFAHQSGGDLSLNSDIERGTEIRLRLPVIDSTTTDSTSAPSRSAQELPASLKVLVVEDRESVRTMLIRSLEHLGLQTEDAQTADDAKQMLESGSSPDVLLTDVMMPGRLDGHALADYANTRHPELAIVLMSGYTESVDDRFSFLRKPFNIDTLEKVLLEALHNKDCEAAT